MATRLRDHARIADTTNRMITRLAEIDADIERNANAVSRALADFANKPGSIPSQAIDRLQHEVSFRDGFRGAMHYLMHNLDLADVDYDNGR